MNVFLSLHQAGQASDRTEFYLSAGRTETVLVCPDSMPAEAADLVSTGAGEEVDVVDLQRFHTQWALHRVVLHVGVPGHHTVSHHWNGQLSEELQDWKREEWELS